MKLMSSESIVKIAPALVKVQKNMGDATKDSKNPFFKSSYADLNAVREVALPALNEQGISVLQPTVSYDGKNYVRTLLLHESGGWMASDTEIVQSKQNDPQAHGSGISYARRYGLQSVLNIGAVDDDAEAAVGRTTKPAAAAKAETKSESSTSQNVTTVSFKKPEAKSNGKGTGLTW